MLNKFISKDFRITSINQVWRLSSGLVLLVIIPIYLSPENLGYWYTFVSLGALIYFADMGFSTICLQFAAHEFASLNFRGGWLIGPRKYRAKLTSFWRFTKKLSLAMALITLPIVLLVGYLVLRSQSAQIIWLPAWVLYGVASVLIFTNGMVLSFIEGCDRVGDIQRTRFEISFLTVTMTVGLLISGFQLYALPVSALMGAICGWCITCVRFKKTLSQLNRFRDASPYPWWLKVKPLISRYSISWTCGYLIFSLFTPIAFIYLGEIEAGKIGFSLAICTAIFSISNIWIVIITPKINIYISRGSRTELNVIFFTGMKRALVTYLVCCAIFITFVFTVDVKSVFSDRLVEPGSLLILLGSWFFQLIISTCAVYMRAHKEEPLLAYSIFSALYVSSVTLLLAKTYPSGLYFLGYLSSFVVTLPWVLVLFNRYVRRLPVGQLQ